MHQNIKPTFLLMFVLAACQFPPDVIHSALEEKQAPEIPALLAPPLIKKKATELHLTKRSVIHIMSVMQESKNAVSNGEAVPECKDWDLPKPSILIILKNGTTINAHDWHYLYNVMPCEVNGVVEIDSSRYKYKINAGSYFLLYNEDTTYYFECRQPTLRKYFPVEGGDPGKVFNEH